jgi:DNA-binding response OmpR family regulator
MGEREILIADGDSDLRKQMAESFREAGYDVETTDSAVHVFCTVLEKQMPVVLLGSGFDRNMALTDLVRLLKNCNRHLTIILVSDDENLPVIRTIRQEGIFYHALKPASQGDTDEILAAVACAFNSNEKIGKYHTSRITARQTSAAAAGTLVAPVAPCAATAVTTPAAAELSEVVAITTTKESRRREEMKMRGKAAAILTILIAAIAGLVYCAVAFTKEMNNNGGDLVIWGFLGFCAVIIVGQLIPAFFSFLAAKKEAEQRMQNEFAAGSKKQEAYAVFDKNE